MSKTTGHKNDLLKKKTSVSSKAGEAAKQDNCKDNKENETEIKNAHAAGMGTLGISEENQIERINDKELENDDVVY